MTQDTDTTVVANPSSATEARYRPDVDGLRAVAVLSVVGFHAFPGWIRGGFIGVDVFFVISGFLISSLLFERLDAATFSFRDFYARRIKRIFPSLLLVLACSLAVGWFTLFSAEYRQLATHAAAGAAFLANIVLSQEAGYFDNAAETKPLLHLWSLGVEEQFYLAWPLLVWLAWKRREAMAVVILALLVLSLSFSIHATRSDPIGAFFSPLTRFWELLGGSLLAWWALKSRITPRERPRSAANLLATSGLLILCTSVCAISRQSAFPGWWVCLPVVGTLLVIAAGDNAWPNRAVLAHPIAVWFGLISYPLYLWHWPLLSFAHIVEGGVPDRKLRLALVATAILLAWLTYRWIEHPIRFGDWRRRAVAPLSLAMLGLAGLAVAIATVAPLSRTPLAATADPRLVEAIGDWAYPTGLHPRVTAQVPFHATSLQDPQVLVVGDSHVQQLAPRILELAGTGGAPTVAFLTRGGCPPIPGVREPAHPDCAGFLTDLEALLRASPSIRTLIVGACWNCYLIEFSAKELPDGFAYYLESDTEPIPLRSSSTRGRVLGELGQFLQRLGRRYSVHLLLDNPSDLRFDPSRMLGGARGRRDLIVGKWAGMRTDAQAPFRIDQRQADLNVALLRTAIRSGVQAIDQLEAICPAQHCEPLDTRGRPIYKDTNHMRPFFVRERATFLDATVLSPARPLM